MTNAIERVPIEPIAKLLRLAAPKKAADLDALLLRLSPNLELDRSEERILFQADSVQKIIRIGMKCTCRLQAHALAAGVILAGIGTPGFKTMSRDERQALLGPADYFFTWAVGRDLQQWLKQIEGYERDLVAVLPGGGQQLPDGLLSSLSRTQRTLGEGLFRYAAAYIVLHELGHLHFGHVRCEGYWSIQQEKEVDRFAAEWLLESATNSDGDVQADRLNALFGISVALLWLTIFNVYLGQHESQTHPESYDRLFQVLDQVIDPSDEEEYQMVWYFVSTLLFMHMHSAGFNFTSNQFQSADPRDETNSLIDMIAKQEKV